VRQFFAGVTAPAHRVRQDRLQGFIGARLTVGLGLVVVLARRLLGVCQLVRHVDDASHGAKDLIELAQALLQRAEVQRLLLAYGLTGDRRRRKRARESIVTMDHPNRAIPGRNNVCDRTDYPRNCEPLVRLHWQRPKGAMAVLVLRRSCRETCRSEVIEGPRRVVRSGG
jgi:hypothetical protein